jgi:hypothetical protein
MKNSGIARGPLSSRPTASKTNNVHIFISEAPPLLLIPRTTTSCLYREGGVTVVEHNRKVQHRIPPRPIPKITYHTAGVLLNRGGGVAVMGRS